MDFDLNPPLEVMEDVKVKVDSPDLVDFNPWAVSDASVFLRYCCPECSFQCSVLSQFSEHALSVHHDKAKTLFDDQEQGSKEYLEPSVIVKEEDYSDHEDDDTYYDDDPDDTHVKAYIADLINKSPKKKTKKNKGKHDPSSLICQFCDFEGKSRLHLLEHHQMNHIKKRPPAFLCDNCDMLFSTHEEASEHSRFEHEQLNYKGYVCNQCSARYSDFRVLLKHTYCHDGDKRKQCKVCKVFLPRRGDVHEHMKTAHPEVNQLSICHICGFETQVPGELKDHLLKHNPPKRIPCDYCEKTFPKGCKLKFHIDRMHPESGEKNYTCEHCGDQFIYEASVKQHRFTCNKQEYLKNYRKSYVAKRRESTVAEPKCDYCDFTFKKMSHINEHYERIHPNMPKLLPGVKIFKCGICDKDLYSRSCLEVHNAITHGIAKEGKNICDQCKMPYKNDHKCSQPDQEKNHECPHCFKILKGKKNFDRHLRNLHSELKFKCHMCDKKLATESYLKKHIKWAHSPAFCDICGNKSSCENELKRHRVLVHKILKGAWLCQSCPKSVFFSQKSYDLHLRKKH